MHVRVYVYLFTCSQMHTTHIFIYDFTLFLSGCTDPYCRDCFDNYTVCQNCMDGLVSYQGQCVSACPDHYQASQGICVAAPSLSSQSYYVLHILLGVILGVGMVVLIAGVIFRRQRQQRQEELHTRLIESQNQGRHL